MKNIFEDNETEAAILVGANNAFNSLNRMFALQNVQVLCPQFSPIVINTYRKPSRMIVLGKDENMSREWRTEDNNITISFYAIGIMNLLRSLKIKCPYTKQISLADDVFRQWES